MFYAEAVGTEKERKRSDTCLCNMYTCIYIPCRKCSRQRLVLSCYICSRQIQLAESDVENTVLVVEVSEDGIGPITQSMPPTVKAYTSIRVGKPAGLYILHTSWLTLNIHILYLSKFLSFLGKYGRVCLLYSECHYLIYIFIKRYAPIYTMLPGVKVGII